VSGELQGTSPGLKPSDFAYLTRPEGPLFHGGADRQPPDKSNGGRTNASAAT
jgi:hypothetical protein